MNNHKDLIISNNNKHYILLDIILKSGYHPAVGACTLIVIRVTVIVMAKFEFNDIKSLYTKILNKGGVSAYITT